jgi:hypothetical protein
LAPLGRVWVLIAKVSQCGISRIPIEFWGLIVWKFKGGLDPVEECDDHGNRNQLGRRGVESA